MKASFSALLPLLALIAPSAALAGRASHSRKPFGVKSFDHPNLDVVGNATFKQNVDHKDLSLGTFEQRYWWDASHWKAGGPIFVFNPGESAADNMIGYLHNSTVPGRYAQHFNGAVILIEHRYWGKSIPFPELNADTLQHLNLPNAMKDMTNFAKTAQLEFCDKDACNSDDVPWVLIGGSYSGALAAWTSQMEPNVFWAYHASSAVVEAIYDFWAYFSPIEEALPRNCSADVKAVIRHVDFVFANGDANDITALKTQFGLEDLNGMDFADTLANPLSMWQGNQQDVIAFCDYIETQNGTMKPLVSGVGLVSALRAYASFIRELEGCGTGGIDCNTWSSNINWNKPTDLSGERQWDWMICNEPFGWYQVGPAVSDGNNIVSSQLRPEQYQRRCDLKFPKTNGRVSGSTTGWTEEHLNMWTKGWNAPYERVFFVNGQFDPWRSATLSSDYRPGGKVNSTSVPVYVVKGGVHTPELFINEKNPNTWPVIEAALAQMSVWLKAWKKP